MPVCIRAIRIISAPGEREGLRLVLLDAGGFTIDVKWDLCWPRNGPFMFADLLRANGTRLWISSGNGQNGSRDVINAPIDVCHLGEAIALETITMADIRAFRGRPTRSPPRTRSSIARRSARTTGPIKCSRCGRI
ncbi:hypothetical protein [Nocardia sp. NPDC004604]|uniref:hypothetical protein n=1 Tax=Nocardia sp. NPDC004604 TaxID=3157013 RepID=UPI0033B427FB